MDMYRFFDLIHESDQDRGDFVSLVMLSGYDGEFGPISLRIVAELDSHQPEFRCNYVQTSAASPADLHVFRAAEISYFVTKILPLFNPQNKIPDGSLSQSPQNTRP